MDQKEMTQAAVLYYQHGMTHAEVGEAMGWSRIKATRGLQRARDLGLVRVIIEDPVSPFDTVERSLCEKFGLDACRVAPSFDDGSRTLTAVGQAGGEMLDNFLPDTGVVGIAMSRAVGAMVEILAGLHRPELVVAAVAGSLPRTTSDTASALAIDLARRLDATAYTVPAPLHSHSTTASAFRSDPSVIDALQVAADATHLIVGVGSMRPGGGSILKKLPPESRESLVAAGAVGDIASRFFDTDAAAVESELEPTMLSLTLDQVLGIPQKLVVAAGRGKSRALSALLSHGLISSLAVDADLARSLLASNSASTEERTSVL